MTFYYPVKEKEVVLSYLVFEYVGKLMICWIFVRFVPTGRSLLAVQRGSSWELVVVSESRCWLSSENTYINILCHLS